MSENKRQNKGKSLIAFPSDFVVLDLETTGYDPNWDLILEVGLLRVRGGKIVDRFQSFVDSDCDIDEYITELTGITEDMIVGSPSPEEIIPFVRDFIGNDIIVGHSVSFDINFLYDLFEEILGQPLTNDFVDTLRISRKVFPELEHHRLSDIASALGVHPDGAHRAIADCLTAVGCYDGLREYIISHEGIEHFINSFKRDYSHHHKIDLRTITADGVNFDETHPLYGKRCVFTGTLDRMSRAEAAQLVVNIGGICDNGITKKTNYLILGNNDYCSSIKDGKSSKQKKAEEYKLAGIDIEIIPENVFYDLVEE